MKTCKWCNQDIDKPVENAEERMQTATAMQMGREIYYAILDKRMRSIDLCNWDYSLLKMYRYSLEPRKILTDSEKVDILRKLKAITENATTKGE